MTFFVPGGWRNALPGSVSQPLQVGAAAAGALSGLSRYVPRMPRRRFRGGGLARGRRYYRAAQRLGRQARQMRGRRFARSGVGVTFEDDRKTIYRRKRMPFRKRKAWRNFNRKVKTVAEKNLGTRTVVFNTSFDFINANAGEQVVGYCALYGLESPNTFLNDLKYISNLENRGNPTQALGITVDDNTKFFFHSGILDITMRNISGDTGSEETLISWMTLETDVYEIVFSRRAVSGSTNYDNIEGLFSASLEPVIDDNNAVGEVVVTLDDRGATPWDFPSILSRYGMKILKKTKYFIRSGQTATYQIRDPKRRVAPTQSISTTDAGFNKPGWTRHVLIIAKSVPSQNPLGVNVREILRVGMTRKYTYKIEGANEPRSLYVQG